MKVLVLLDHAHTETFFVCFLGGFLGSESLIREKNQLTNVGIQFVFLIYGYNGWTMEPTLYYKQVLSHFTAKNVCVRVCVGKRVRKTERK